MSDPSGDVPGLLLRDAELTEQQREACARYLGEADDRSGVPWYVHPLLFGGAVLAAAMLSVGLAMALEVEGAGSLCLFGLLYIAVAVTLHRVGTVAFLEHLALALSIGGHVFVLLGLMRWTRSGHEEVVAFAGAAVLCAALYAVYRAPLHRFGSCLLVCVLAKLALPAEELDDLLHAVVATLCFVPAYCLTRNVERPAARPLSYACAAGLVIVLLPIGDRGLWFGEAEFQHPWISSVVAAVALLWAARWAARQVAPRAVPGATPGAASRAAGSPATEPATTTPARIAIVSLAAGLAALGTPGIPAALFLMVLGHAAHHWPVALLALASLPVFLWQYYYSLDVDFLEKSGVLVASGVVLLLARWVLAARSRGQGDES